LVAGETRQVPQPEAYAQNISVRLPVSMIEDLKILANKRDVPYQSLLKVFWRRDEAEQRGSGSDHSGVEGDS